MRQNSKIIIFLTAVFISIFTPTDLRADMIEVKGKGVISGTIVSETESGIIFKDSYGQVQAIARSDITYTEKEGSGKFKDVPSIVSIHPHQFAKKASGFLHHPRAYKSSAISAVGNFPGWLENDTELVERTNTQLNLLSQSGLDFIYHGRDINALISDAAARVMTLRKYKSDNLLLGGLGMSLMFLASVMFVVFGFRLIADAFEQHFLWGVALLAIPLSCAAPLIGGSIGLFAMVPYFASLGFVAAHWRIARATFVSQIFCANIFLFGFFFLQLAS